MTAAMPADDARVAGITTRQLTPEDVDELVSIHLGSWAPYELSTRLGPGFLRDCFYRPIAESGASVCARVALDGAVVAGYAVGYVDYPAFNKSLARGHVARLLGLVARRALTGRLGPRDILWMFLDARKLRLTSFPRHQLGAIALAPALKGTARGGAIADRLAAEVLAGLSRAGCAGVSGFTDERNRPMQNVFERHGFSRVAVYRHSGKGIVVYERRLR